MSGAVRLLGSMAAVALLAACSSTGEVIAGSPTTQSEPVVPGSPAVVTGPMTSLEACWLLNDAWRLLPDWFTVQTKLVKERAADAASFERMSLGVQRSLDQIAEVEPYLPADVASLVPRITRDWTMTLEQYTSAAERTGLTSNPQAIPEVGEALTLLNDIDAVGVVLNKSECGTPL